MEQQTAREAYFNYLCSLAHANRGPGNASYYILCKILFKKEFYPILEQDSARGTDGEYIRQEWADGREALEEIDGAPCNMLEFFIGLSRRLNYYQEGVGEELELYPAFYILLKNLRLEKFSDEYILGTECDGEFLNDIHRIVDRALERDYAPDGDGGFFPITFSDKDQRDIPIWYQMTEWMREQGGAM